jgi:hypothetical protein
MPTVSGGGILLGNQIDSYTSSEGLQGEIMEKKAVDLVNGNDGTVTDPSTGLMWMAPFVGQGWNSAATGSYATYTWPEATERYGRGRLIEFTKLPYIWAAESTARPVFNQESYKGYQAGKEKYFFAGYSDWRMPIIEEVFTLMDAGVQEERVRKELGSLSVFCTANPSTTSLYERRGKRPILRWLLGTPNLPFNITVWEASLYEDVIFGDRPASTHYGVRLVRSGYLFQATH